MPPVVTTHNTPELKSCSPTEIWPVILGVPKETGKKIWA